MTTQQAYASKGGLWEPRARADYTEAEREFSWLLSTRLAEVLQGKRNSLQILRKYPSDPMRVGVLRGSGESDRTQLRGPVVEQLTQNALRFVQADVAGGPIAQVTAPDGDLFEIQSFPTKYPHILIERVDRFANGQAEAQEITWTLRRVQNQQVHTQVNHLLDATTILFELVRLVR